MGYPLSDAEHAHAKALIESQPELIVAAAIRVGRTPRDQLGVVLLVERPGRHGNCINVLHRAGLPYRDQGFVTNRGRFVERDEAARIAIAAGQASPREGCNGLLFSEDIWNDLDEEPTAEILPEEVFGHLMKEGG